MAGIDSISLYSDALVDITADTLTLHNYYFFGWSKVVQVKDIKVIKVMKADLMNGQWRLWGAGWFGAWAPLDWNRPSRDRIYHLHYKHKKFIIGFTVINTEPAEQIMRELGLMEEGNPPLTPP